MIVAYNEQAFPCFVGDRKDTMDAVSNTYVIAIRDVDRLIE